MKNFGWLLLLSLLFSQWSKAQETDSTQVFHLENAVITGQYSPQSVDKSLYDVEVISAKDIKNQAGNTVADVLNQNLNILIVPSTGSGDSTAEMLGLSGSYVKVLVDNIPLVADSGMGNNIDLTKINLDNVERIEIVKGAMGVDYGNNAMAGIINIITKKNIKTDWKINMMIQEETVGKEYDWYEDGGVSKGKGRHIQAVDIGHKLSDKWYISAGLNRNDFQGFWGEKEGRKYLEQNGNRGYEWLPKEQWNGNGLIRYSSKNFSAFYKLSYLHEEINAYDSIVNQVNFTGGERTFQSNDRDYFTKRWTHHLN
ncbi:MAG: TonB-dependent receptor plug domain-containing protein, partial [Moheibacter sp.]